MLTKEIITEILGHLPNPFKSDKFASKAREMGIIDESYSKSGQIAIVLKQFGCKQLKSGSHTYYKPSSHNNNHVIEFEANKKMSIEQLKKEVEALGYKIVKAKTVYEPI